jgi:hypothetical protein
MYTVGVAVTSLDKLSETAGYFTPGRVSFGTSLGRRSDR